MEYWELTPEEIEKLSDADKLKYETAHTYMQHDWAEGPYGGWVRGKDLLIELGWAPQVRKVDDRTFVYFIKPEFK